MRNSETIHDPGLPTGGWIVTRDSLGPFQDDLGAVATPKEDRARIGILRFAPGSNVAVDFPKVFPLRRIDCKQVAGSLVHAGDIKTILVKQGGRPVAVI